jgi:hypothetical protein
MAASRKNAVTFTGLLLRPASLRALTVSVLHLFPTRTAVVAIAVGPLVRVVSGDLLVVLVKANMRDSAVVRRLRWHGAGGIVPVVVGPIHVRVPPVRVTPNPPTVCHDRASSPLFCRFIARTTSQFFSCCHRRVRGRPKTSSVRTIYSRLACATSLPRPPTAKCWLGAKKLSEVGAVGDYQMLRQSPDDSRVAVELHDLRTGAGDLWLLDIKRGSTSRLMLGGTHNIMFAGVSGRRVTTSVFMPAARRSILVVVAEQREVGAPISIAEPVDRFLSSGRAMFTTSRSGTIAYHSYANVARLVWVDRSGREVGAVGPPVTI